MRLMSEPGTPTTGSKREWFSLLMVVAAGYARVEPWEECRFSFLDFHVSTVQKEERDVGLGTLLWQRETVSPARYLSN